LLKKKIRYRCSDNEIKAFAYVFPSGKEACDFRDFSTVGYRQWYWKGFKVGSILRGVPDCEVGN
jgi:hypothetical protein